MMGVRLVVAVVGIGATVALMGCGQQTGSGSSGGDAPSVDPGKGGAGGATTGPQIFEQNCAKCHPAGGSAGGEKKGGNKGPDLSHAGSDPDHTADWLADYIKNPKSKKPGSRMPPFEGKLSPEQIRTVAEHLASLQ